MPATPTTPTAGGDASFRKEHAQLLADNERMRARLDALETTMQALASAHGGPPPAGRNLTVHHLRACESEGSGEDGESSVEGGGCPLRVVFIQREGRRRLANLDEHVAVCNSWRPPARAQGDGLKVHCRAHSFKQGLKANIPLLRKTDVLIGPHGTPAGLERCRPCLTTPFDLPARCPLLGLRPLQATQSMS